MLKHKPKILKFEKPKKLKFGIYPYTYVRTTVMKSLLFKKEDYHKMLKMSFNEIAKLLQDSHYKQEINALAREYSGSDLLELALNKNLAGSFKKLIKISSEELVLLIKEYVKRKDIEDIKTILRGKFTNTNEELVLNSITAAGTLSLEFLTSLLKKESIEEVLKANKLIDFSLLEDGLKELKEKNTLAAIENAMDKYYYSHLIEFSKTLPKQGVLFRNFLRKEVEILNILTMLRLRKTKIEKKIVNNFIIPSDTLTDSRTLELAGIEDLELLSEVLEKKGYKNAVRNGVEEFKKNGSLITLETELYKYLLDQSILLLHQHPLSVDVILGYMLAKD
ncbi:MAG: V-type ATPase subunit, partial [Patescibacteria group bacterium]